MKTFKVLEGKFSYVVTTHIDKGHVHNHIIFCAADNMEHNKYHDCKQSYYRIRKLSDELCSEHNLSVIIPGGERGKKYNEWQSDKNGTAWKTQIRKDINAAIKASSTYEEFLLLMRAKGYEIKGEAFGEDAPKFISFRPLGKDRFVRGSVKSLGREYTKERIKERIELKRERKAVIPKRDYADKRLIDTSDEKFQNSPGLQRWAAVENLKIAAQAYNEVVPSQNWNKRSPPLPPPERKRSRPSASWKTASKTLRKSSNMRNNTKQTDLTILPIRNQKILTHISASMKARLYFMAAQGVCWNRRASI